jgi:hypothetical protein
MKAFPSRFSIRSLMAAIAVLAIILGIISWRQRMEKLSRLYAKRADQYIYIYIWTQKFLKTTRPGKRRDSGGSTKCIGNTFGHHSTHGFPSHPIHRSLPGDEGIP